MPRKRKESGRSRTLEPSSKTATNGIKLQPNHRRFCDEYLANGMLQGAAAKACRFRNPSVMACRILARPEVREYLQRKLAQIQEEQWLRKEQLLAKMRRLNDFNLMKAAAKGKNGMLEINQKDYDRVAEEIGDCVTEVEFKTVETENGDTETTVRIKLMDKDKMFDRELKYHGILDLDGNVNINIGNEMDWNRLCEPPQEDDVVEGRIEGRQ